MRETVDGFAASAGDAEFFGNELAVGGKRVRRLAFSTDSYESSKEAIAAAFLAINAASKLNLSARVWFMAAAADSRPKVQIAPLCVLVPFVTRSIASSAALPVAASVVRRCALGRSFME